MSTSLSASAQVGARIALSLPVERYRLGNGLNVRFAPDPSLDDVSIIVHYDVGSADDPPGKEGLAHLVEHLTYDGSRHVAPGDYARMIGRAGGSNVNGLTSLDATDYVATVPPASVPLVLWLESDRMGFVVDRLNQLSLDKEVRIIGDETRDRVSDQNLGAVGALGRVQLFPPEHPYHRDGAPSGLSRCSLDDVRAFLRTWYSPSNATIGIAGRFDPAQVKPLIAQYFGDLTGTAPPVRPDLPSEWIGPMDRIDTGAGVAHDVITFLWRTPALDQPGDGALDLAASILADPAGRLQDLVARRLALSVSARQASSQRASVFWISAVVADTAAPNDVTEGIARAVAELGTLVRPEEFQRAHDEWLDIQLLRIEGSLGRASALVRKTAPEVPWQLDKYDAVGPDDVARAVLTYLTPNRSVIMAVHHDRRYPAQGVILHETVRSR